MNVAIAIEYGAIRNANTTSGGWLPQVWEDGRELRSTWAPRSLDRDEAISLANELAIERARKFIGDWSVTITARQET